MAGTQIGQERPAQALGERAHVRGARTCGHDDAVRAVEPAGEQARAVAPQGGTARQQVGRAAPGRRSIGVQVGHGLGRERDPRGRKRLAQSDVHVHGSARSHPRQRQGARHVGRAATQRRRRVRRRQVDRVPYVLAEEARLADRLVRADVHQLGGAIGREQQQGHAIGGGFDGGGKQVGHGRARGRDDRGRTSRGPCVAERVERSPALVEPQHGFGVFVRQDRAHQGCGARARRHHEHTDALRHARLDHEPCPCRIQVGLVAVGGPHGAHGSPTPFQADVLRFRRQEAPRAARMPPSFCSVSSHSASARLPRTTPAPA